MDQDKIDNILQHFGIKGMKWNINKLVNDVIKPDTITEVVKPTLDVANTEKIKALMRAQQNENSENNEDPQHTTNKTNALGETTTTTWESVTPEQAQALLSKRKPKKDDGTKTVTTVEKYTPEQAKALLSGKNTTIDSGKLEKIKNWIGSFFGHMESNADADAVLAHFGIFGMKWGKKKSSFKTTRVKSNTASDYDKAKALKAKGIKNLSNEQINTLLKRMNLEKQMKDAKVSELKRGEEIAKTILSIGTTVTALYALSKTPLGEAIRRRVTRTP